MIGTIMSPYKAELDHIRLKIMKFHSQDGYFKDAKVKSILRGMGKRA